MCVCPATAAGPPAGAPQPLCSLWRLRRPLRREPGPQRRQRRSPFCSLTAERARPPAATTRAAAPSAVSGDCAGHCGESRAPAATTRAAAPSAVSGDCAGHCGESRAPSGDNARRSPFSSLSKLRRPLRRQPGPKRRQRAPQSLLQSLETTPVFCGESRVFSGDNARCSPFCSLTAERAGPPAATTRAAAPSAVSGDCAATAERAGPPAATTRAAAPSAVSGDYAGHCGCEM